MEMSYRQDVNLDILEQVIPGVHIVVITLSIHFVSLVYEPTSSSRIENRTG